MTKTLLHSHTPVSARAWHFSNTSSQEQLKDSSDKELVAEFVKARASNRPGAKPAFDPSTVLALQSVIGNRAVQRMIAHQKQFSPTVPAQIQRAVTVGDEHFPRKIDETWLQTNFNKTQAAEVENANKARDKIYKFTDEQHLIDYYKGKKVAAPTIEKVKDSALEEGHETASMIRFGTIYEPSSVQIPKHAPGAHSIAAKELPPSGPGHHWVKTRVATDRRNVMWKNRLKKPKHRTQFHPYGDPKNPSLFTSQGKFNMGGRVMPTSKTSRYSKLPRSKTSYARLKAETGKVRGHPFALEQTQYSTDPKSSKTFDNDPMVYTRESDGTKGGFSTFRYNQIERPAIKNMLPFNQVNVSSDRSTTTSMGIPETDTIFVSMKQPDASYRQLEFDNDKDYNKDGYKTKKRYSKIKGSHAKLAKHVETDDFPYEKPYRHGDEFEDPDRHSYPGYMSPPPTPFLTSHYMEEDDTVTLPGLRHQNEMVEHAKDFWFIQEADYDKTEDETTCKLVKVSSKPFSFT